MHINNLLSVTANAEMYLYQPEFWYQFWTLSVRNLFTISTPTGFYVDVSQIVRKALARNNTFTQEKVKWQF